MRTSIRKSLAIFPSAVVLLLLSLAGSAYAHHGFVSWFDMSRSVTVKGTVTSFDWTNPHSYIYFDVKDEKGAVQKWSAELGAVAMLARVGWRKDTLKPGDEITFTGNPAKDGKPQMHLDKIVFANGQELSSAL
jgi:exonuclease VII large subunit